MSKTKVHTRYYKKDGKTRVAGTTTILGILDKPALIHWAWNLGLKGEDYRKVRDKAASIGTIAHEMIEYHLKKEEIDLSEYSQANIDKAKVAFNAFLNFEKAYKLKPIEMEIPLVSEKYGYGGSIDLYAELNGKKCLIDFKTSKAIYPTMKVQVAAYKNLLEENGYPVDECHLLRVDKESGEFNHHAFADLSTEWKFFKLLIPVYILKKVVDKK